MTNHRTCTQEEVADALMRIAELHRRLPEPQASRLQDETMVLFTKTVEMLERMYAKYSRQDKVKELEIDSPFFGEIDYIDRRPSRDARNLSSG